MKTLKPSKPWWIYVLRCADGTLYCGATTDVEKRVATHNAKKGAKYTLPRLPVSLVYFEAYADRSAALVREHAFKKLSRAEKMKIISRNSVKKQITLDEPNF